MRKLFSSLAFLLIPVLYCWAQTKTIVINNDLPLQGQFKEGKATYVIKGTINLQGGTIILPAYSTLQFNSKGGIKNGTIQGKETTIGGRPYFDGVHLKGTFTNTEFYASWSSPKTISGFIEDVMNLSDYTVLIIDKDVSLSGSSRHVNHLNLRGSGHIIYNSDRYFITYGGCDIFDLKFKWTKGPVKEPKDNYNAVIVYSTLLQKDTTITTSIRNVVADGGGYCSYFMKQYSSSIVPRLRTVNLIENNRFVNFTRGAIWTCGGTGKVVNCKFLNIGYETSFSLYSVFPLCLGFNSNVEKAKAVGYEVRDCEFSSIVSAYNSKNDGRELHGLIAYGDSLVIHDNQFSDLSTKFSKSTDTGMDSEMLYIKGSFNLIEKNTFKNGAGSLSDGVVTMKTGATEGNVIRNNYFLTTNTSSKFVYLGGYNHTIDGNTFTSTDISPKEKETYAIYLGYQEQNGGRESVIIQNNTFSFSGKTPYMVVYANRWGDITLSNNILRNPWMLLKCNKRNGSILIQNNEVMIDNVHGNGNESFILISRDNGQPVIIKDNLFTFYNSKSGILVNGSNYRFIGNRVTLTKSSFQSLLRGAETDIEAKGNSFSIDNSTRLLRGSIVGEKESSRIKLKDNRFEKRKMNLLMKK